MYLYVCNYTYVYMCHSRDKDTHAYILHVSHETNQIISVKATNKMYLISICWWFH